MTWFKNSSLTLIMILGVLIGLMAPVLISGWYFKEALREDIDKTLHERRAEILDILAASLEQPLWSMEKNQAEQIVWSFMSNPHVVEVVVKDLISEREFLRFANEENRIGHLQEMKTEVSVQGKAIGEITLTVTLQRVEEEIREILDVIEFVFALQLLSSVGIILFLLRSKIFKPLGQLMRFSHRLSQKELNEPFVIDRKDQLGSLGQSLENARSSLAQLFNEIDIKNVELTHKNKQIMDSIEYARNIQKAMHANCDPLDGLCKEHFLIDEPREFVGGDTWHIRQLEGCWYISVIDCTGHGVPGALMSIMAHDALDVTLLFERLREPTQILAKMNEVIYWRINRNRGKFEVKDGMEMSLLRIDPARRCIHFAGAGHPLWRMRRGEIEEIKGSRAGIGEKEHVKPYETHEIHYESGDRYFLFTDGIIDQPHHESGKPFGKRQLKSLLIEMAGQPLSEQKEALQNALANWQGSGERVDDVTVLGFEPRY